MRTGLVTVDVTAEDIDAGEIESAHSCPVALAVKRAFRAGIVTADSMFVVMVLDDDVMKAFPTPKLARRFMSAFDAGELVQPFSFEIALEKVTR